MDGKMKMAGIVGLDELAPGFGIPARRKIST